MRKIFTGILLAGIVACQTSSPAQGQEPGWTTAREWNRGVVGWNLGNQLECSVPGMDVESVAIGNPEGAINAETAWGNPKVTKRMIRSIKEAGFNAVRIPVRWQSHISNERAMTVDKEWMARVREIVDWCLDQDLKVVINTHHDKWLESRPVYANKDENCQKLALLWFNIASEFSSYDSRLAFAGTNEVHVRDIWGKPEAENLAVQNAYNQTFIDIVRSTGGNNLKRNLIVQTYVCNPDFGLYNGDFIVPADVEGNGNDYMTVEFHYYNPWDYAGEATFDFWGTQYRQYGPASESDEETMRRFYDTVAATWGSQGLGIMIGEWGVTDHCKGHDQTLVHENMTYYCKTFVSEAGKRGFSSFVWDNNRFGNGMDMFGIFDRWKGMKVRAPWILEGIRKGKAEITE